MPLVAESMRNDHAVRARLSHERGAVMAAANAGRPRQRQRGTPVCAAPVEASPHAHLHAVRPASGTPRITWWRVTGVSDLPDLVQALSRRPTLASVPRGMRRGGSQKAWLRTFKEDPEVLGLRRDGYANLMRVANLIAWHADWDTMCSRPTIKRIVEVTGLAKPTMKRWVRWLRERGWLGVVEQGTTCRYRKGTMAGLLADGLGNRAAAWVL
jgi:hypothetical protein